MSGNGITIPSDIRDPRARHYYITRMARLCEDSDCIGSTDPAKINAQISPILNKAKHIYAESLRIQQTDRNKYRTKNLGLGKFALG